MFLFKVIILFPIIVLFNSMTYANLLCEETFTEPDVFALAMTEGLKLKKGQDDLFSIYRKIYFGNSKSGVKRSLDDVIKILEKYPELSKLPVREQKIILKNKNHKIPQSLIDFVKRFRNSANEIRNNLFSIYENLGFWRRILSFPKPAIDSSLSRLNQREIRKTENEHFLEYLNKFVNEDVLQFIKEPSKDNIEKTIFMYQLLNTIKEDMVANSKDTQAISQAMVDLVHTSGFGNQYYTTLLKSKNPREQLEGINKILDERDVVSLALGFEDHFSQLRSSLNVDYPSGSTKNENFVNALMVIEKDIVNMPYISTQTSVIRVRPLSIQESPFRSCLGGSDCSSATYFEKALDPNFLYFTVTDNNHKSSGQITVVLGTAKNKTSFSSRIFYSSKKSTEKIGFVDKIQNVPNYMILPILESIRLSLSEQGYKLGLPKNTGDHNGLSNTYMISDYIKSQINPILKTVLTDFTPHKNKYSFNNGYSNAYSKPKLLEFKFPERYIFAKIESGEIKYPREVPENLNVEMLYKEILSLQHSEKEEDLIQFINSIIRLSEIEELDLFGSPENFPKGYTKQFIRITHNNNLIYKYLIQKIDNPTHSFKLRKLALFTLIEFLYETNGTSEAVRIFLIHWHKFSKNEQDILVGEMSNWEKSNRKWQKYFLRRLSEYAVEGLPGIEDILTDKWRKIFIQILSQYAIVGLPGTENSFKRKLKIFLETDNQK